METTSLGGISCHAIAPAAFWEQCREFLAGSGLQHIVTLNPEMIMEAQHNQPFTAALRQADWRVPDGAGIIWANWYLRSSFWPLVPSLIGFLWRDVERITGVDIVQQLASQCAASKLPLYLLGGTAYQVKETAHWLKSCYPELIIFTAPPHQYSLAGPADIVADIQQKKPAVLLVAYGAAKQTIWIERWRSHLPSVKIAVGVGGAFAIISEELPRAPRILRTHNLEWLWRLILEPKRLPRIWQATVNFPLLIRSVRLQKESTKHNLAL